MNRKRLRGLVVAVGLAGALAVVFVVPSHITEAPQVGGEINLQLLTDAGMDPFTVSVVAAAATPPAAGSTTGQPAANPSPAPTSAGGAPDTRVASGSDPGLYAGIRGVSSCDAGKLSMLLSTDASRASAWALAQHIAMSDVGALIKSLTSAVLRQDVRVTAHGYRNRAATTYQAVLQSGTAVLVDPRGTPRVRCVSGDPLSPPGAPAVQPVYLGIRWPGFGAASVETVRPATGPLMRLILFDLTGRGSFARPIAGDGTTDTSSLSG